MKTTPSVIPIRLRTPFAVGDVFCYLLLDEKTVLVDCGHFADAAYERLAAKLNKHGRAVSDIDEIWLTHGHPDHFGQARRLQHASGARVLGHKAERQNFAVKNRPDQYRQFFEAHGIDEAVTQRMLEQLEWLEQYQQPIEPEWISEADTLSAGEHRFSVQHLPGHAPGHLIFYNTGGLIFGGDVLLSHISTNALINFDATTGRRNPSLLQYRQSLQAMAGLSGTVRPGHGEAIADIESVARRHLKAQEVRFKKLKAHLQGNPQSLMQLSTHFFADALRRGEHFLVFSELRGFLDWGEQQESIASTQKDGVRIFEAVAE